MNGLNYDPDDLALSGINVKGFFTNVKKTVKTVGQKVGQAAKVAVKAVVKFNPLSIAARGGFLLAMKLNLGKMASKLKWAYGTQQQATAKNVSAGTWQKSKDALVKVERLFADKLQGSRDALKNAILKGRAGNLSGYVEEQMSGYLGDPASATVIAAAAPVIIATIKILKESGLIGKDENVDINTLTSEVSSDPGAANAAAEFQQTDPNAIEKMALTTPPETSLAPAATSNDPSATPKATSGGIMNFIKTNPVPAVIGGGLLAFGIYQLVKPRKKATGLSGYRTKRKPATTTKKTLPKKTTTTSRANQGRSKKNITPVKLF
jgi:hypothetical protein